MIVFILFLAVAAFLIVVYLFLPKRLPFELIGKHALVTGGSKGIGKAIAAELLQAGCKMVTLVARDKVALEKAREELEQKCAPGQSVQIHSFDVGQGLEKTKDLIRALEGADCGPVDLLVNNAGTCLQGAIDELPEDAFKSQMRTNFFSATNFTRAVLPQMKMRRRGHIAFVSSAAGQIAIWGYSAYSPSKFAIRAFADALYMELAPFGIGVSVLFPPNTATEGFQHELATMPEQIRDIGDSGGIFLPEHVASALVRSIRCGDFWTCIGLNGQMLGLLTAGSSPEPNPVKAMAQIFFAGLIRAIMLIYNAQFAKVVQKYHGKAPHQKEEDEGKKET